MNTEREAFERIWGAKWPGSLRVRGDGSYISHGTQCAWDGWQADRASAPAPEPVWKVGNEFAPFHPQASHINPDYRDGWNACYEAATASAPTLTKLFAPELGMDGDSDVALDWRIGDEMLSISLSRSGRLCYAALLAGGFTAHAQLDLPAAGCAALYDALKRFELITNDATPPQAAAPAAVGGAVAWLYDLAEPGRQMRYASVCDHERRDDITDAMWLARKMTPLAIASPAPDRYEATDAPALSMSMFATSADYEKALRDSVGAVPSPPAASDGARGDGGVEPQGEQP